MKLIARRRSPARIWHEQDHGEELVQNIDFAPTFFDLAGATIPTEYAVDGRSLRPLLEGQNDTWEQEIYMEQEETRSIRTSDWLFMRRFAPTSYEFMNELYDLQNDAGERNNLADDAMHQNTVEMLSAKLDAFFDRYADPKWNLWKGGAVKSNSTRPFLWREVWGDDWKPSY